jgi:hypothetical protein
MPKARTAATERFRFDPNSEPWPTDLNFWDVADYLVGRREHLLNEGELDFICNMQAWPKEPTDKQLQWLYSIYQKVG